MHYNIIVKENQENAPVIYIFSYIASTCLITNDLYQGAGHHTSSSSSVIFQTTGPQPLPK
jgi:hypothetical protein